MTTLSCWFSIQLTALTLTWLNFALLISRATCLSSEHTHDLHMEKVPVAVFFLAIRHDCNTITVNLCSSSAHHSGYDIWIISCKSDEISTQLTKDSGKQTTQYLWKCQFPRVMCTTSNPTTPILVTTTIKRECHASLQLKTPRLQDISQLRMLCLEFFFCEATQILEVAKLWLSDYSIPVVNVPTAGRCAY